jgi:uncharacterized membrane protein YgaE (UPF0421/DUF939 family)
MIDFIQTTPDITSVNELLNYALGALVAVVVYLYVEKNKQNTKLQDKIEALYLEHKDDFKEFSQEKSDTFLRNHQTMQKMMLLLDQLKDMLKDGR